MFDCVCQLRKELVAEDDELMEEVLETFENLQNVTQEIIQFFLEPHIHHNTEKRFLADTCEELNIAFTEALSMVCLKGI